MGKSCRVCGDPNTVKSHVIPRALMLDLRGQDSYLHEVTDDRKRTRFLQSGPIDDQIFCLRHEGLTQRADRYGIDFCRRAHELVPQNGLRGTVPNPDPDLLVEFACLMVYRFCISKYGTGVGALGPYGSKLQEIVFADTLVYPMLFLARNHLRVDGQTEATIAIAPFPVRLGGIRCWLFCVSGVQFFLKLDQRPLPGERDGFAANKANPVMLLQLDPMLTRDVPILQQLMSNMAARRQ